MSVVATFAIDREGELRSFALVGTSGQEDFDAAVGCPLLTCAGGSTVDRFFFGTGEWLQIGRCGSATPFLSSGRAT